MNDYESLSTPGRRKNEGFFSSNIRLGIIAVAVLIILVSITLIPVYVVQSSHHSDSDDDEPVNVIFMISDGFGPASQSFARYCIGENMTKPGTLPLDSILVGTVQTYSSDTDVTDSAAGATAYSCATKTYNGAIGVDPNVKPCGTLLEAAKAKGLRTALVVTSRITHATPGYTNTVLLNRLASFSAHVNWRDYEEYIAQQQVEIVKPDIMFGGGLKEFQNRSDHVDLLATASTNGYQILTSKNELFSKELTMPVLGLFADDHMSFEIDRDNTTQPSLAEMVTKALGLLEEDKQAKKNGFFLMIEGSRIDMAAHNNDASAHLHDIWAYNDAIQVALNYVKTKRRTIIISTSDHETGGLTLGRNNAAGSYPQYVWYPEVVKQVTMSTEAMCNLIIQQGNSSIANIVSTYAKINLTQSEIEKVENNTYSVSSCAHTIGDMIAQRANIGWTTWGHTGTDINLYSAGYASNNLRGNKNNIDIGGFVADLLGVDLEQTTQSVANVNPIPPAKSKKAEPEYTQHSFSH